MDPFNSLSAELNIQVLVETVLNRTTLSLITSSPTMLQLYTTHRDHILELCITMDFDEPMIQDAIFIVLCPDRDRPTSPFLANYQTLRRLLTAWKNNQFRHPLLSHSKELLKLLENLHNSLLFYIEDYLTKATAVYPPRQYLCLPDKDGNLTFKGQKISKTRDVGCLTSSERKRFFRTFLRSELTTMVTQWDDDGELHQDFSLHRYMGRDFRRHEWYAFNCVRSYKKTLVSALAAQHGDFWLPDIPQGSMSETDLLPPDSFYVDASSYRPSEPYLENVTFNTISHAIRRELSKWREQALRDSILKDGCPRSRNKPVERSRRLIGPKQDLSGLSDYPEPGLYTKTIDQRNSILLTKIYEQRAWAFLDDDRLFPQNCPIPVMPTTDEVDAEYAKATLFGEWVTSPSMMRQQRRSQTWHEARED